MPYTPDPRDETEPVITQKAKTAAEEFRSIKRFVTRIPIRTITADDVPVLTDAGGGIYHPPSDATARNVTFPANATVPYQVGTVITIANDAGAGALTISVTTDTLVFSGPGTTGARTLAAGGQATLFKVATTRWMISGVGLT